MNLRLDRIEITDLQARAATDQNTVAEYAALWLDGVKFPDIIVFHDGTRYFLADGFHRCFGAAKAGLLDINAEVRKGSQKDALWFAVGANREHGLKRSNADKRRAVELALKERPELSANAIAKHVGVSQPLVSEIMCLVSGQVQVLEPENSKTPIKRKGLDGKSYPVPVSKPPVPVKKSSPPPPVKKPEKPPAILDKTGWPIPPDKLTMWHRAPEAQELMSAISKVRGALRKAQDEKDKLFVEVNFSSALSQLDQAYADVKTALPFAVCPTCQGRESADCMLCGGRGFVSEFRWKNAVPEETRALREKAGKK